MADVETAVLVSKKRTVVRVDGPEEAESVGLLLHVDGERDNRALTRGDDGLYRPDRQPRILARTKSPTVTATVVVDGQEHAHDVVILDDNDMQRSLEGLAAGRTEPAPDAGAREEGDAAEGVERGDGGRAAATGEASGERTAVRVHSPEEPDSVELKPGVDGETDVGELHRDRRGVHRPEHQPQAVRRTKSPTVGATVTADGQEDEPRDVPVHEEAKMQAAASGNEPEPDERDPYGLGGVGDLHYGEGGGDPGGGRGGDGGGSRGGHGGGGRGGGRGNGSEPDDDIKVEDIRRLLSFPFAVQSPDRSATTSPLALRIRRELRAAVGPLPERPSAQALRQALAQRTSAVERSGVTLQVWRDAPLRARGGNSADLAGQQAALVSLAEALRDAVVPIVRELDPAQSAPDMDLVEARRQILIDLVEHAPEALAVPGGFSTWQLQTLHRQLGGRVAEWGNAIGVARGKKGKPDDRNVHNAADAARVAQYEVVRTWVNVLEDRLRRSGDAGRTDLGSGLYVLEQNLAIVAGAVRDFRDACRVVQFETQQRERTRITIPSDQGRRYDITLEGLLRWTEDTAADELPALLDGAGRPALDVATATLEAQRAAVEALLDDPPAQVGHLVVRQAAEELRDHLERAEQAAADLVP